jgi:IPT/TIG domain
MKRTFAGIFSAIFSLTSCTTFLPEHIATANVDAITFAILTELYCAASHLKGRENELYFASDDYWVAGIDMYLSAQIEASANPAVSLLGPFNLAKAIPVGGTVGSFTSVFSGSIDETRTNMHEYKIYVYLKRLVYGYTDGKKAVPDWKTFAELNRWPVHCENPNAGGTYLQGQLGLADWLAPAVRTEEASVGYAPLNAPPPPPPPPVVPAPTITDVFPKSGSFDKPVRITGTNLSNVTKVTLGSQTVTKFTATPTTIIFFPPATTPPGPADLTVTADSGDATSTFTYVAPSAAVASQPLSDKAISEQLAQLSTASNPPSQSGSAQQSPTITGTFTFTIKSTGTIGPSFTLTRVSGGSANLFTAIRTDNSYVTVVLTAAYYCPMLASLPAPGTCAATKAAKIAKTGKPPEPNADQLSEAIYRIDTAILNQNIVKIAPQ